MKSSPALPGSCRGTRSQNFLPLTACATALAALLFTACTTLSSDQKITGSGQLETQSFDHADFTGVHVSSSFEAQVKRADHFAVKVTADANVLPHVRVNRDGQNLHLTLESGYQLRNATLKAEVELPVLKHLELDGASRVQVEGFASEAALDVSLSGASRLTGELRAGSLKADLSGASHLSLVGAARHLRLDLSGASRADMGKFVANEAKVGASGASKATVQATAELAADASGASVVKYATKPARLQSETSGAGKVLAE